jgi:hypothetical protein
MRLQRYEIRTHTISDKAARVGKGRLNSGDAATVTWCRGNMAATLVPCLPGAQ